MIDGSQKRNRQLAFELQNSQVCEKRSNLRAILSRNDNGTIKGTTTQIFISLDSSFSLKCMGPQIACSYLGWTLKENSVMYKYIGLHRHELQRTPDEYVEERGI